jgi:EAL domain-containing protein (putative c-di-GMP-specific phosphodiesterase class I)
MAANKPRCQACRIEVSLPAITMAFQPIIDIERAEVFAYEALVRPPNGGTAADVLGQIGPEMRYAFDQLCRVTAIDQAARLGMETLLSINFLPNAVYQPAACLQKTFEAAERAKFPLHHLMFEVTENEPARDVGHLQSIFAEYRRHGMITAIDDFGAGHSGLNMLADFQPDVLKIDMALTRAIGHDAVRYEITRAIVALCHTLHISVVVEGVETIEEAVTLRGLGVRLFQGYLFAKPMIGQLASAPQETIAAVERAHAQRMLESPASAPAAAARHAVSGKSA